MTINQAQLKVTDSTTGLYGVLLANKSLEIGFYQPTGTDPQQPHEQDEVYIVQSGSGEFVLDSKGQPFEPGEALFVPAGTTHKFENFTEDFAAWVVFYGPVGGE